MLIFMRNHATDLTSGGTPHSDDGKPAGSAFDIVPIGVVAQFPGRAAQHDGTPPAVDDQSDTSNTGSGPEGEEEWGGSGAHDDEEWLGIGENPVESDEVSQNVGAEINNGDLGIESGDVVLSDDEGDSGVDISDSRSNPACDAETSSMDGGGTLGEEEVPQSAEAEDGKDSEVGSWKRKSDSSDQSSRRQRKRSVCIILFACSPFLYRF
jgi:hypothetical protein